MTGDIWGGAKGCAMLRKACGHRQKAWQAAGTGGNWGLMGLGKPDSRGHHCLDLPVLLNRDNNNNNNNDNNNNNNKNKP